MAFAGQLKTAAAKIFLPVAHKIMCEAQRIDLKAVREGKITWRMYFETWGLG